MIWPFKKTEKKALGNYGSWMEWFTPGPTSSGVPLSNESAMSIATVFACIRNISEDVAKIPLKIYRKSEKGKELKPDHPLLTLLNYQPNPEMTAMDFRQTLTAHCLGWGNAYAEIERTLGGEISGLFPLHPSIVRPKRTDVDKILVYEVRRENGSTDILSADTVLHIRGIGDDGIVGYNVIHYARECMGSAKAAETFGSTYFGNNTSICGVLKHPDHLSKEAQERLRASIESKHRGPENANRLLILEESMSYEKGVLSPEESQFLETRQFSVVEICRWFRMPPHKVQDLQRATFSNIEHQDLEYVKDCLMAWLKRWEEAIWLKLFSLREQSRGFYAEHVVEGLLRGDIGSRYSAYQIALGNNNNPGFMTINEIRKLENLDPLEGGDDLYTPQSPEKPKDTYQESNQNEEDEQSNQRNY